ncbi:hypothetical protein KBI52_18600 [Microvirga sp. HBU67558]|uniref:hypothetical protein n=1 Tax=Microvirga TaxID=186650 RepID=UPI001B38A680|nr:MULTISPECIES: hypothetical protein [unclassified Microvirga]MBQ0822205.1 hypothetical protein [Microvirga sp. HBU67558]
MRALEEREPEDRLATVPDFFVAEVRLEAAAARFGVDLDALRAFEADFTALRLELREADLRAVVERAEDERETDFLAADLAGVFFAVDFLAVVFLAAVFLAALLAVVFFAADFADERAEVFVAEDFAVLFLAVVFFAPDLADDFAADREVDFAADFLAAVFFVPAFLAVLVELRRALLLFFAVFLVLVAPVSPVNSIVSGFDLVSVGIAASFKGLRVQPSRLQGNVVIPSGFRLSKSVDSRTCTFSVDILRGTPLCTCRSKTQYRVQDETVRDASLGPPTHFGTQARNIAHT